MPGVGPGGRVWIVQNLSGGKGILVQQEAKGVVQFRELAFERGGTFKKSIDTDGPELLVIRGGIGSEEVILAGLHTVEYRSCDSRKILEMVVERLIPAFLYGKVDVTKGVGHFVEADVLSVGIVGEFADEVGPGEVDPFFADMPFEWRIIESVAVFILENIDGPEKIELKMFQAESQLYGGGADKQGHAFFRPDINIFKIFKLHKYQYTTQEACPSGLVQAFKVGVIPG